MQFDRILSGVRTLSKALLLHSVPLFVLIPQKYCMHEVYTLPVRIALQIVRHLKLVMLELFGI